MNSAKWRELEIPAEILKDLVASHIYAMRGMDRREITSLDIPYLAGIGDMIKIRIQMKEVKPS